MTLDDALTALRNAAEDGRAAGMADYHKVPREYLGVPNPAINDLAQEWRGPLPLDDRVALADPLWNTNIFEAPLAAAPPVPPWRTRPHHALRSRPASHAPAC